MLCYTDHLLHTGVEDITIGDALIVGPGLALGVCPLVIGGAIVVAINPVHRCQRGRGTRETG